MIERANEWAEMSHKSDNKSSLSQPLRVETEDNGTHNTDIASDYFPEESQENENDDTDSLGPLPPKWEKAYTESGEVYFIE